MWPDGSHITLAIDRRSGIFSSRELAWRLILESGLKIKPWFQVGTAWCHQVHFWVIRSLPQTSFPCPKNMKSIYKGVYPCHYFMFFQINGTLEVGATTSAPNSHIFHSFIGIFHHHGSCHFFHNRERSLAKRRIPNWQGLWCVWHHNNRFTRLYV